jgi:hypothetical protein
MEIISGYKTYAMAIAVILTQLANFIPGVKIDPEIINAASTLFGVLACVFNYYGRKKLAKKAVK